MTEIRRALRRFMKLSRPNPFPWFDKTNVNQSLIQKADYERSLTRLSACGKGF